MLDDCLPLLGVAPACSRLRRSGDRVGRAPIDRGEPRQPAEEIAGDRPPDTAVSARESSNRNAGASTRATPNPYFTAKISRFRIIGNRLPRNETSCRARSILMLSSRLIAAAIPAATVTAINQSASRIGDDKDRSTSEAMPQAMKIAGVATRAKSAKYEPATPALPAMSGPPRGRTPTRGCSVECW